MRNQLQEAFRKGYDHDYVVLVDKTEMSETDRQTWIDYRVIEVENGVDVGHIRVSGKGDSAILARGERSSNLEAFGYGLSAQTLFDVWSGM